MDTSDAPGAKQSLESTAAAIVGYCRSGAVGSAAALLQRTVRSNTRATKSMVKSSVWHVVTCLAARVALERIARTVIDGEVADLHACQPTACESWTRALGVGSKAVLESRKS